MDVRVYIDGFNLYYGALKNRPGYKWLDLVKLSQKITQDFFPNDNCQVRYIRYFTSWVEGKSKKRQKMFIQALESPIINQGKIEIHYGSFRYRSSIAKLTNIPIANQDIIPNNIPANPDKILKIPVGNYRVKNRILPIRYDIKEKGFDKIPTALSVQISRPEEKRTDVNIASHLLNDAWKNLFDVAIIISNDSDLVAPIEIIIKELDKQVCVISPQIGKKVAGDIEKYASKVRHMRAKMLKDCLLPDKIPGTNIRKPREWQAGQK